MSRSRLHLTALALVAALLAAGCGSSHGDKAGGSNSPVVLRLQTQKSTRPSIEQPDYFAAQVSKLSHGSMRIDVVRDQGSNDSVEIDARIARAVQAGDADLGWMAARGWERLGIDGFRVLQAPFVIDNDEVAAAVAESPVARKLLAGLDGTGFEGLALVPAHLRYLFGLRRPLVRRDDFRGARVRVVASDMSADVVRALGAKPAFASNRRASQMLGRLDGREGSLDSDPVGQWLTANLTPFAKMITLFGSRRALDRLDDGQREILRRAAAAAVTHAIDEMPPNEQLAQDYCKAFRVTLASVGDLAEIRRATRPVTNRLARDPRAKAMLAEIEQLKAGTSPATDPAIDPSCSEPVKAATGPPVDPKTLDGTYRWHLTEAGARRAGTTTDPEDPAGKVITMTLRDGRWVLDGPDNDHGTFVIRGDRLVFDWPAVGYANTFSFVRRNDGTLVITPVLPMDAGDQYVWASSPWKRVGPPVRQVP